MPNQIKIRPLKDKLRQFFSPIVYECSVFRNNGKPIGGFADENEIADAFSPTHNYVVGEPCIYENVVRVCTTPHNGNWDASHFRSVSVMGYAQEIVKNLGMPSEYDPDYEYNLGDYCTHGGLWYRSLYGYSGGGAGAWDETKWERVNSLDEIDALNQNVAELQTVHTTELTSTYISTGIKIWRCGKMARMTILGIKNLPTGQTNIATIPQGYRPYEVDAFVKDLLDANLSPKLRLYTDTSGAYLRLYNYTGATLTNTNLQFETEYFTQ